MALALLFQDDSVMYIDAVENYTKSYNSSLSNHPIDGSAVITDHVTKDNPSFSLKGVISAADFHTTYTRHQELLDENINTEFDQPVNGVQITNPSTVLDYLPGSIQQFLTSTNTAEVTSDPFRGFSHQVARERLDRAWKKSEIITILDYDYDITTGRSVSVRRIENCLIQNYTDNEDVSTGDAFEFTISFQKVRFAYLKEVDIRVTQASKPSSEVSDETSGESDKGDVSSASQDTEKLSVYEEYKEAIRQEGRKLKREAISIMTGGA